ncbi:MAG: hypothetical protein P4M05_02175 [Bradyrhizobium sp.]|nr:hypothetical protein [Bradyrhizobium sp.]
MADAEAMSKNHKMRSEEATSASRSAFWNGVLEGFGGPLMMGTPVRGCLNQIKANSKTQPRTISVKVNGGVVVIETASLAKSSKEIASALQHATQGVMRTRKLVYRILNDRKVGRDGKFHPIKRVTVEAADPTHESRQQSRDNAHLIPRRG